MERTTALSNQKSNNLVGTFGIVPQELVRVVGAEPVNLYRMVQTLPEPTEYALRAEQELGLPKTICLWVKCVLLLVKDLGLSKVMVSVPGVCPYTKDITEYLMREDVEVQIFNHPVNRDSSAVRRELELFMSEQDIGWEHLEREQQLLEDMRATIRDLDTHTFEGNVSGFDNYAWLQSSTDFFKPDQLRKMLFDLAKTTKKKKGMDENAVRLAYIGGPCALRGLHGAVEQAGGKVVYNEFQYEESMIKSNNLINSVDNCTLLYSTFDRIGDLMFKIRERKIQGLLFYSQRGCNRDMQHSLISKELGLPAIVIRGDKVEEFGDRRFEALKKFIDNIHLNTEKR